MGESDYLVLKGLAREREGSEVRKATSHPDRVPSSLRGEFLEDRVETVDRPIAYTCYKKTNES